MTKQYKITVMLEGEIFPYIDVDEEITNCFCYESLADMKKDVCLKLDNVKDKIQNLTMKRIKEGVKL